MKKLLYVTANEVKYRQAIFACEPNGIELQQAGLHITEIQAETGEPVALDKAQQAFEHFQQPIVVSDDSWMIPGLNNFPGPYMKSMNAWFTVNDWLHLTSRLEDRRIILRQIVVYQDAKIQKLFALDVEGVLLTKARGKSPFAHCHIVSLDDGKHAIAEFHERNESAIQEENNVWHEFVKWYGDYQP